MNDASDDIRSRVEDLLSEEFDIARDLVVPSARLKGDLGLDSIDGVDLLVAIEKKLGVRVDAGLLGRWITVGDVGNCVAALQ